MLISSCPRATHCISINLVFTWKQVPRNGLPLMSCEGLDCKSRARGGISSKGNIFGILCVMTASIMCHWPVVRCCASAELWMKDSYMELNHFEKSCIRRAGSPLQSGAQAICRQREMRRLFCFIVGISLCRAIMWLFQFNDLRVCKTLINSMHPCQKRPGCPYINIQVDVCMRAVFEKCFFENLKVLCFLTFHPALFLAGTN